MYKIDFREKALKVLGKTRREHQLKINSVLDDLRLGRFNLLNVKKIQETKSGYRFRIGRWRVLFTLISKEKRIEIVNIFLKKGKEDYKKRKHLLG